MRKILAKGIKWFLLAALIFGIIPASAVAAPGDPAVIADLAGQGRATTTVSVTPMNSSVGDCALLDIYIDVNTVTNLYAIDVRLSFDTAVVEVVSMTPVIDPVLQFTAGYTVRNIVNNFSGTLWYAAAQTNPTPPANGSGHVLKLTLRAKSTAITAFTFTYIKLSDPNGVEIPATGVSGSVSASSNVVPNLDISRLNSTQVQLSWPAHSTAEVGSYQLFRSATPYFEAIGTPYQTISNPGSGTMTFDDSVLGNVTTNYFYAMRGICTGGTAPSGVSRQVGKFEFQLFETTGLDHTWVGLEFDHTGIADTQLLADHIQNNSNGNVSVNSISRWNAAAQNSTTFTVDEDTPWEVFVKRPYRVSVNVDGEAGSVIWAQVGWLPAITTDTYTLYETTGTDYTWILQPLDMTGYTLSSSLASNIETQSTYPLAVLTISRWNGSGQTYTTYDRAGGDDPITVRFGYPYRVAVNINTFFSVTWP